MGLLAILFAVVLVTPIFATVFADVYVPPGPCYNMSEWISPTLTAWDLNATGTPQIGWNYTQGPSYNVCSQKNYPKVEMSQPMVPAGNELLLPFGTTVMVLGFIPGVTVSMDQSCPPIELTITWNGVPNTVTIGPLGPVGANVPPTVPKDQGTVYQAAYPGGAINKHAAWGEYDGPASSIFAALFAGQTKKELNFPQWGLWFWYKFTPNVGDYISFDCQGKTNAPPTYDVTALLEYGTSQVWFNHVCWDVRLLEIHKTVTPEGAFVYPQWDNVARTWIDTSALYDDNLIIANVGLIPATGINVTETFPQTSKYGAIPNPTTSNAVLCLTQKGKQPVEYYIQFPPSGNAWFQLKSAGITSLKPGQNATITEEITVFDTPNYPVGFWNGTIVFDSMLQANEIPAWKDPIGLYAINIGDHSKVGGLTYLWTGNELYADSGAKYGYRFGPQSEWLKLPTSSAYVLRCAITLPTISMVLDPVPVSLSGGALVTGADVSLVRNELVGLAPYDSRMDLGAKGFVSLQDLAAYKAEAGQ